MKHTKLTIKTLRQDPSDSGSVSNSLMIRSGLVSGVESASGVNVLSTLGLRSHRKIENIMRYELDSIGCQELLLPALQPAELWDRTGRLEAFGSNAFTLTDRHNRTFVLAPTHEELITCVAKANIRSYRDLPATFYQIQTKYRDEARPRAGLIRAREFFMKDAYSFNKDDDCLAATYQAMSQAYFNIFRRSGVPVIMAEADSGAIGGKESHEFLMPTPAGEDTLITCADCGYAANAEKAVGAYPVLPLEPELPLETVPTFGQKTISQVSIFLGLPESRTLKSVFYMADSQPVMVTIRGDLEVNEVKLKNALQAHDLAMANNEEVQAAGLVPGYASPIGLTDIKQVADLSITSGHNFAVGANCQDKHLINANFPRDFKVGLLTDIALTQPGHLCLTCRDELKASRGIEVGHIFKLGTVFTKTLAANYDDIDGKVKPITMGCYGIGVGRLLAAAIEHNHDNRGIIFPPAIAPIRYTW